MYIYGCINPAIQQIVRPHSSGRCNSRFGHGLRNAGNPSAIVTASRKNPKKNCRFFRNLNPDSALRSDVYYTFGARGYTSTRAVVSAAGAGEKVPGDGSGIIGFLGLPQKCGSTIFRRLLS
jgi:hypothetical protein